jgi:drug/metabolite transporter (DMT)-like permease
LKTDRSAIFLIVVLGIIWGYAWVVNKITLDYAGPFDVVALRTLLGVVCLFGVLVWKRKALIPTEWTGPIVIGLLQIGAFQGLSTLALVHGGAGKTAVLIFTAPFWVLIFAWPILGERIRGIQWLAVILAFIGLVLILQPWALHASLISSILAVLSGMAWAASTIVAKRIQSRSDVDPLSLTAWQLLLGVIPLCVLAWVFPSRPIDWAWEFILGIAYAGVIATAAGWLLWHYILHRVSAGTASLNALAVPAVALLASWIQLGEEPNRMEMLGILLIGVALFVISSYALKKDPS